MKNNEILKSTDHRRTYILVKKEMLAGCSRCPWHADFWGHSCENPIKWMIYEGDPSTVKRFKNSPSWKIVSKNKKQWMKKKFISTTTFMDDGSVIIYRRW